MFGIYGYDLDILRKTLSLQRNYNWEIMLPDIAYLPGTIVSLCCQDIRFGDYGMSDIERVRNGAYESKYPGYMTIPDIELVFLKPLPDIVSAYFYEWRKLVVDDVGFYGVKADYAKSIWVYLYDVTGVAFNRIQLVGVYPSSLPKYDLSYTGEDITRLRVGLNVDRMAFGQYQPPEYVADTDVPITRSHLGFSMGSGNTNIRQATNAAVFQPQSVGVIASRVSTSKAVSGIFSLARSVMGIATNAVSAITASKPNVIYKPIEEEKPSFAISSVAKSIIGTNSEMNAAKSIAWKSPSSVGTVSAAKRVMSGDKVNLLSQFIGNKEVQLKGGVDRIYMPLPVARGF